MSVSSEKSTPQPPRGFTDRYKEVNGIRMHYVVLLHGYPQTSHEWFKVMPALGEKHTVIAPDLRGGGQRQRLLAGYDKKTMAKDLRDLPVDFEKQADVNLGSREEARDDRGGIDNPNDHPSGDQYQENADAQEHQRNILTVPDLPFAFC